MRVLKSDAIMAIPQYFCPHDLVFKWFCKVSKLLFKTCESSTWLQESFCSFNIRGHALEFVFLLVLILIWTVDMVAIECCIDLWLSWVKVDTFHSLRAKSCLLTSKRWLRNQAYVWGEREGMSPREARTRVQKRLGKKGIFHSRRKLGRRQDTWAHEFWGSSTSALLLDTWDWTVMHFRSWRWQQAPGAPRRFAKKK